MLCLGIETSCDETSCAILEDGRKILSNIVLSQTKWHKEFFGVVPEIASRKHTEFINAVIDRALKQAKISIQDIDLIGVTTHPGLIGSLFVGLTAAKIISMYTQKPIIGINHIEAHLQAAHIEHDIAFPYLGIVLSGGHTLFTIRDNINKMKIIGTTLDDAIGEAFDKVAKFFKLGYPGGPIIDKLAQNGSDSAYDFPIPKIKRGKYNVSFSGLKTAVIHYRNKYSKKENSNIEDLSASFQRTAVEIIRKTATKIIKDYKIKRIVISGGVAANSRIRKVFNEMDGVKVFIPSIKLCTDNGAMIASLAYYKYIGGYRDSLYIDASPRIKNPLRFGK